MADEYDVVIVGAGVAGSVLAKKLGRLNVLVIEKERGHKVDSGIVSTRYDHLIGKKSLIEEKLHEMMFTSPSNKSFSIKSEKPFAYRLKRKKFSKYLRSRVRKNIVYENVNSVIFGEGATVRTDKNEYQCSLVIGCDGAHSLVREAAGIKPPKISFGILAEKRTPELNGRFNVYLNKYFSPDFFAWMLSNEYGLITAVRPQDCMEYFMKKLSLKSDELHGSAIPVGFVRSYADNCILLGDSAGQTKPLTGGGIIFSMLCVRHAADVIKMAFEQDYFKKDLLGFYEKRWKREIGPEIGRQLFLRNMYRHFTNRQIDTLFDEFGASLEKISTFDYDKLSSIAYRLPKWKLVKTFISTFSGR
jgi:flavin-dependent dehydrogenase